LALWVIALAAAFALGRDGPPAQHDAGSVSALRQSLDQSSPVDRSFGLSRAFTQLNAESFEEAIAVVEADPARWSEQDHRLLMAAWTRFDDLGPVDWALSQRGMTRSRAAGAVIETLAFRDPLSARSVVDSLEDADLADKLHDKMILGWARSDFRDDLSALIAAMPPGIRRQKAAAILAIEIRKDGAEALIQWAEDIPDDARANFKEIVFDKAANSLALADPAHASRWIRTHLGRSYAARAAGVITQRWLEQDPVAALDWALTLPASANRDETVASGFASWLERNPVDAEAWVLSSTPAPAVDPAVRVLVRRDYLPKPASALDWAHRIDDPGIRQRVLAAVGRSWFARDPEAVKSWLPESGLEQQIQHVILHSRPKRLATGGEATAESDLDLDDLTVGGE
jgi:hypothetical protein